MAFLYILLVLEAIPIDNGVEGDPEIECGASQVTVNFNTRNPFEGHVYVKGLYNDPACRTDEGGARVAGIQLPFDLCNVQRIRSLNPRGVFTTATVVVSFHPQFVTKVDRAYSIQCFYMEAEKTVSQSLEVSMLTTAFFSQQVPMPICRYEILDGGPDGQPILYTLVGQPVYHKWTCDSETSATFCMLVHSCYVDDGAGDQVDLLDENGCALDRYLLRNLEYLTDLMAGQEAHVFKYADRPQLYFQCQITITVKEPTGDCPKPQCVDPERGRRSLERLQPELSLGTLDVRARVDTLDLEAVSATEEPHWSEGNLNGLKIRGKSEEGICVSLPYFAMFVTAGMFVIFGATMVVCMVWVRRK